jgi:hypothetical protein
VGYRGFEYFVTFVSQFFVFGAKNHTDAVTSRLGQVHFETLTLGFEEIVGNLKENSRSVTGDIVGACGASVMEIHYCFFAVGDNGVVFFPVDIYDRTDTAGVVLKRRVI